MVNVKIRPHLNGTDVLVPVKGINVGLNPGVGVRSKLRDGNALNLCFHQDLGSKSQGNRAGVCVQKFIPLLEGGPVKPRHIFIAQIVKLGNAAIPKMEFQGIRKGRPPPVLDPDLNGIAQKGVGKNKVQAAVLGGFQAVGQPPAGKGKDHRVHQILFTGENKRVGHRAMVDVKGVTAPSIFKDIGPCTALEDIVPGPPHKAASPGGIGILQNRGHKDIIAIVSIEHILATAPNDGIVLEIAVEDIIPWIPNDLFHIGDDFMGLAAK